MKDDSKVEFNIFRNLGLNENQHSNVLKKLLHPNGSHQQGNMFLLHFLEMLNIDPKILDGATIEIKTEQKAGNKGRVDLFIKIGDHIILVENKINGAVNQPHQLYRYWKNLIFNQQKFNEYCKTEFKSDIDIHRRFFESETNMYKLIYLTKSPKDINVSYKESFELSKKKPINPSYDKLTHLPIELPMPITCLSYNEDIAPWLKKCISNLVCNDKCAQENILKLKIVLEQYLEHLKY